MSDPGFFERLAEWFTASETWSGSDGVPIRLVQHVETSLAALGLAALLALPVAMYIGHRRRHEFLIVSVANLGRAIPSFGLVIMFVTLFGVGLRWPEALRPSIIVAMFLLAIPPILTNTYVAIQSVAPDTLESARGMGMTERQILRRIELPLAAPVIVAGLRTAAVQVVATATLGAVVGGGGLGRFIVDGIATRDFAEVFGGALFVALLAILTEIGFGFLERRVTPRMMAPAPHRGAFEGVLPPQTGSFA